LVILVIAHLQPFHRGGFNGFRAIFNHQAEFAGADHGAQRKVGVGQGDAAARLHEQTIQLERAVRPWELQAAEVGDGCTPAFHLLCF
jgi:hypothetical protein